MMLDPRRTRPSSLVIPTGSRPASSRREEPSTPVQQDVRTPSGASNAVPFVIPRNNEEATSLPLSDPPCDKQMRLSASSGCSDTATPPGSPHSHGNSTRLNRVTNERDNCFHLSAEKKERRRTTSFTHARCMNCNSQFIVNTSSPPCNPTRSINGEFCSGECRCSFLASAIDQQYCNRNGAVMKGGEEMDSSEDDEW